MRISDWSSDVCSSDLGPPEAMIYIELRRVDARARRDLLSAIEHNLADVRAAVSDWDKLQEAMRTDAARLGKGNIEGAALLEWFLDRHFTLLGHETWMRDGTTRAVLGIARNQQAGPMLAEASRHLALAWFEKGGEPPLLLKSNLISTVHRAVPLDLAVVPIIENGKIAGLSIHAGDRKST